ncbi:histidine phosphatase family protein [Thermaerobacillus caldiproteolyticus]|uniref:histidine phosphatase family protein n=1 Tax=Thermaerobacillus caldiproteolyticus TaxID=247480 RepID=UPI00188B5A97|nr:histidine phosphatase family protein [Anoxybacillus caldiproteolyticus]QPA32816.1 histidine phosphatase family protein [Anoxybacillus caldiproteolyticus]
MLTLYFTRHGETEWNVEKRMQGWQDSPLTEKGKKDAIMLGKRLESIEFAGIYTSTSGRTVKTAQLIRGERLIPIYQDEHLREIYLGDWEGKTHEEIMQFDPIAFDHFWNQPHLYSPKRGERFIDVQNRAFAAIQRIIEHHQSGNVLIVTHAVVLKSLIARLKNLPLEQLWAPPFIHGTSVTIVQVDHDTFTFVVEGDVSHLEMDMGVVKKK